MRDYLGNNVQVGNTVIIPVKEGRTANLGKARVVDEGMRNQFRDGPLVPQVKVQWSNIHEYWMPARRVVMIPDEMLPEKRRETKLNAEEAVVVS